MNLLQVLLMAMTAKNTLSSIAEKTGLSDKQLKKLITLAIPLLLKHMTSNASSESGALSLLGALSQHTNKKEMDKQIVDADEDDGRKIIGHILGKDQKKVTQDLSEQTGIESNQITKVLSMLAPALMSGVSEAASTTASAHTAKPSGTAASAAASSAKPGLFSFAGLKDSGIFSSLFGKEKETAKEEAKPAEESALDGTALLNALLSVKK